jgi:hypothetical protein
MQKYNSKKCEQRIGGFSQPVDGKIICKFCEKEIEAGLRICPECGKKRMLCRTELRYCGMKIHGTWGDFPVPHNKSMGRGESAIVSFDIDSGDYQERQKDKDNIV